MANPMKIVKQSTQKLKHTYTVEIPSKEIESKVEASLLKYGEKAKIPGFRPGKIPLNILKQRYEASAREDALNAVVKTSMNQIMKDNNLRPASQPKIDLSEYKAGGDLTYDLAVEVLPDVEVKDFKKLSLTKLNVKITEKDVDEHLQKLLEAQNRTAPVSKARKSKEGDTVVFDALAFEGETAAEDQNIQDFHMKLGSNQLESFEKALTGKQVGDQVDVEFEMPKAFPKKEYAGKKFIFKTTLKELREPLKIELSDDLAKEFKFDDLKSLKEEGEKQLTAAMKEPTFLLAKRQILDSFASDYNFELPESLVEEEFKIIWHEAEHEMEHAEKKPSDKEIEKMKKEYQSIAERRVRLGLVLAAIGQEKNISVPKEKLSRAVIEAARQHRGQEQEAFEYYSKTPEALARIRAPLLEDEVITHIIENANTKEKEVSIDQLKKEIEKLSE